MKAIPSLLAVLLMLSSTSLAQTAPAQQAAPAQQTAADESSKPDTASQPSTSSPSPTASTPSAEADAAGAGAVPAAPSFAPGAKLFLEPMNGFNQLVSDEIIKKKVPVVVVNEREKADFVMSGDLHVKKRGFFTGMVMTPSGKANIAIKDARTGNVVFAHTFKRVDTMVTEYQVYKTWAGECAKHMKKAMETK